MRSMAIVTKGRVLIVAPHATLADRTLKTDTATQLSTSAVDFYDVVAQSREDAADLLGRLLGRTPNLCPTRRALRVLLVGFSSLARALMAGPAAIDLIVLEADRRKYERVQLAVGTSSQMRVVDQLGDDERYDLVIAAGAVHRLPSTIGRGRCGCRTPQSRSPWPVASTASSRPPAARGVRHRRRSRP